MKILLPVDHSDCCKATLVWVQQFLDPAKVQLFLLNVLRFDAYIPEVPMHVYDYDQELSKDTLEYNKHQLEALGFNVKRIDIRVGDPALIICEYADDYEVDQIIIGSHGYGAIKKLFLGSVSRQVFEHAKQQVILVNNSQAQPTVEITQPEHLNFLKAE